MYSGTFKTVNHRISDLSQNAILRYLFSVSTGSFAWKYADIEVVISCLIASKQIVCLFRFCHC